MAKQRAVFVEGATTRGVSKTTATRIFDLMEKFAGYGFNKSHSAAYALLAYQTAYLKAHHPSAFMAAVMSADLDHTDRLVVIKEDCRKLGLNISIPSINVSQYRFSVAADGSIIYGLGAIKGIGQSVVQAIIAEREKDGEFRSLIDFCRRVDVEKVSRRAYEVLIKSGALDEFGQTRRQLVKELPEAIRSAGQAAQAKAAGQNDMFGLAGDIVRQGPTVSSQPMDEWMELQRLANEKDALGLYLTGHPFDSVRRDAKYLVDGTLAAIGSEPPPQTSAGERNYAYSSREVTIAGLIMDIRKRGNRITVVLDDDTIICFGESINLYGSGIGNPSLHDHQNLPILVAGGAASGMNGGQHIRYKEETPLANLHLTLLDRVGVHLDSFEDSSGKIENLFNEVGV